MLRRLTGSERTERANWQIAFLLAFVAGAADVSGYLSLRQFTSHMSGIVAALAADVGGLGWRAFAAPCAGLSAFVSGAAVCALLVNWSRRRDRESVYAVPVLLEAVLLAMLAAPQVHGRFFVQLALLCFSMGLQNAIITKISHAEIRTTHVTGMITDIGIELGRALYWNRNPAHEAVTADRRRLALLMAPVSLFFGGGVLGALAYPRMGFRFLMPLCAALAVFTVFPIGADVRRRRRGAGVVASRS